jgi:UPF0755 protein
MTDRRVPDGGDKSAAAPPGAEAAPKAKRRARAAAEGASVAGRRKRIVMDASASPREATLEQDTEQGNGWALEVPGPRTGQAVRTVSAALGPRSVPQRPRDARGTGNVRVGTGESSGIKGRPVLKLLNAFLTFFAVILLALGGTAYYLVAAVDSDGPLKEPKLLVVPRNDGTQQIAERLEKEGIVGDKRMFLAGLYALRMATMVPGGRTINLKAGEYEIKPGASIRSLVDTMSEGRSVLMRITVPEGLTSWQIVERLKNEQGLTGDLREIPAEGSLLPETYSLPRGSTRTAFIEMMQAAQKKLVDQLWADRQENLPVKTPAEAIVLASVVEKETGRNDERDRVASVFVNRLRKGMQLQSDPTILYGLALGKVQWGKTIFQSEIRSKTAHNTYVIPALPPTPICNPGRLTIEATLKPASTNDLFFVADGRGGHVFAETNRQHEANVAKWRLVERERSGAAAANVTAPAAPTAAPATVKTINAPTSTAGGSSLSPGAQKK